MPQGTDLKYFLAVCQSKNISRASEVLGISQPSLSLAIKRLESIAGVKLLVRSKMGVDLTHAGVAFKERSAQLLELWQNMSSDIKKSTIEVSGRYTLGAHISVALPNLMPIIKNVLDTFPKLELVFEHGLSRLITDQVIGFDIDFALVVNPVAHADLVIRELYQDEVGFFVNPNAFDSSTLLYDPNLLQSQALIKQANTYGVTFKKSLTSSSLEMLGKLAQNGAGVAILPKRVVNYLGLPLLKLWDEQLPVYHDQHCHYSLALFLLH